MSNTNKTHIIEELKKLIKGFQVINKKTHMISLNASMEGARCKDDTDSFYIVSEKINAQAELYQDILANLEQLTDQLETKDVYLSTFINRFNAFTLSQRISKYIEHTYLQLKYLAKTHDFARLSGEKNPKVNPLSTWIPCVIMSRPMTMLIIFP